MRPPDLAAEPPEQRFPGETWYQATDVVAMLACFAIEQVRPFWAVNRWITALLRLCAPQIEVLDDRRLEVTSWIDIDPAAQLDAVRQALTAAEARAARSEERGVPRRHLCRCKRSGERLYSRPGPDAAAPSARFAGE